MDAEDGLMEEDVDGEPADLEALNYDDLDCVSKLQKTQRYNDVMQVCSRLNDSLFTLPYLNFFSSCKGCQIACLIIMFCVSIYWFS